MSDDFFDNFKKSKHDGDNHAHHEHHAEHHYQQKRGYYGTKQNDEHHSSDGRETVGYGQPYQSHGSHNDFQRQILSKVLSNPALIVTAVIAVIVVLVLGVVIVISFMPLLTPILQELSNGGLKGIIDIIWKGTGK